MMDEEQIGILLGKAAAFDQRTTGEADILAWMEAIPDDVAFDDALAAVTRHYRESTDFLRPAHLLEQVRKIRNERAEQRQSEALALPSRFEADDIRDARVREAVRRLSQTLAIPGKDQPDTARDLAIERARRERRESGRDAPLPRQRRTSGKPIDLTKIPGPAWADEASRERESIAALHAAHRSCGRAACTRPTCRTDDDEAIRGEQ